MRHRSKAEWRSRPRKYIKSWWELSWFKNTHYRQYKYVKFLSKFYNFSLDKMYGPLRRVPFNKVRVVVVTKSPFKIKDNTQFLKAWHSSTGLPIPNHKSYSIEHLEKRGVLFMPVIWNEKLTKMDCYPLNFWILYALSNHTKDRKICFIFTGSFSNELAFIIDRKKHLVIRTAGIDETEVHASHMYPSFRNSNVFARAARWIGENPMSFWRLEG